jgi:hypothetical protein
MGDAMRKPAELGQMTRQEERGIGKLFAEGDEHFRGQRRKIVPFTLGPDDAADADYTDRVKAEFVKRANDLGWDANLVDGVLTVRALR